MGWLEKFRVSFRPYKTAACRSYDLQNRKEIRGPLFYVYDLHVAVPTNEPPLTVCLDTTHQVIPRGEDVQALLINGACAGMATKESILLADLGDFSMLHMRQEALRREIICKYVSHALRIKVNESIRHMSQYKGRQWQSKMLY